MESGQKKCILLVYAHFIPRIFSLIIHYLTNLSCFMFMRAKNHFLSAPPQLNTNTSLFASFNSLTITLNKNLLNFTNGDC